MEASPSSSSASCLMNAIRGAVTELPSRDTGLQEPTQLFVVHAGIVDSPRVVDDLTVADRVVLAVGLPNLPHLTTVEKFVLGGAWDPAGEGHGWVRPPHPTRVSGLIPDSSGSSPGHVCRHYLLRIKRDITPAMKRQVRQKERSEKR